MAKVSETTFVKDLAEQAFNDFKKTDMFRLRVIEFKQAGFSTPVRTIKAIFLRAWWDGRASKFIDRAPRVSCTPEEFIKAPSSDDLVIIVNNGV